jgi:hypothetical protein
MKRSDSTQGLGRVRMLTMDEDPWFQYLQPPSARRRRTGGFRAVQLNLVGWTALLAPGSLAGTLIALRFHLPGLPGAVVGGLVAWVAGLVLDRRKFAAKRVLTDDYEMRRSSMKNAGWAVPLPSVRLTRAIWAGLPRSANGTTTRVHTPAGMVTRLAMEAPLMSVV